VFDRSMAAWRADSRGGRVEVPSPPDEGKRRVRKGMSAAFVRMTVICVLLLLASSE